MLRDARRRFQLGSQSPKAVVGRGDGLVRRFRRRRVLQPVRLGGEVGGPLAQRAAPGAQTVDALLGYPQVATFGLQVGGRGSEALLSPVVVALRGV